MRYATQKWTRLIIPRLGAFSRKFKGTSQRRAAAAPSGPLLGSWPIPTTGTLPKATPSAAGGRFLRRPFELFRDPHGMIYWVQNRTALNGRLNGRLIGQPSSSIHTGVLAVLATL